MSNNRTKSETLAKKIKNPSLPTPKAPVRKRTARRTLPDKLRQVADELEGLAPPVPAQQVSAEKLAAALALRLSTPGRFREIVMARRKSARRRQRLEEEGDADGDGGDEGAAPPPAPRPKRGP